MSVTKAGLTGTDRRDGRGRTMGRGLSESRGSVQYVSTRDLANVPTYPVQYVSTRGEADVPTYSVFHRSKDLYLRTVSPYRR